MYYVVIQDAVSGPYSIEDIGQMLIENKINAHTMATEADREEWLELGALINIEREPSREDVHVPKDVREGKRCPCCGGTKIKSAGKEFYTTGFVRVFSPKVCAHCDAIWAPKVEMSTAFLIFAIGIIGSVAAFIIMGPQISYLIGMRDTAPTPLGPSPAVNWVLGSLVLLVSLTAARKSLRYLGSSKTRAFRILRHPHRAMHG